MIFSYEKWLDIIWLVIRQKSLICLIKYKKSVETVAILTAYKIVKINKKKALGRKSDFIKSASAVKLTTGYKGHFWSFK